MEEVRMKNKEIETKNYERGREMEIYDNDRGK